MKSKRWLRYLPVALGALLILLVAIGVYVFRDFFEKPVQSKKQVQQISVVQPPPPPPPPPEVKPPPEPEVKEEKIEEPEPTPEPEPEPEPQDNSPPPGEDLGVDSDGAAGSDAFGLVGKKGGRSLVGSGTGNGNGTGKIGGGGNAFVYYGQQVGKLIQEGLLKSLDEKTRQSSYSAVVNLWINPDGSIGRVELANSSGKADIDEQLKGALRGLKERFQTPPEKMPQPLKIRIRS